MKAFVYDAIAREAAKHGGVCAASIEEGGVPCCPWGMAMKAGVVKVCPYPNADTFFGKRWRRMTMKALQLMERPYHDYDNAIRKLRRRPGRVAWAKVAAELGIVREA